MTVSSVLIPLMAWAPAAKEGMEKAEKAVPGIYKVVLPFLLIAVLLTMVAIAVVAIMNTMRKTVPLEDPHAGDHGKLTSGEMTKFESQSRVAPGLGKIMAVFFIFGLVAFMFGGLYTMGRGSSTTEQLRKEGKEKGKREKERQDRNIGGDAVGDDSGGGGGGSEFGGMLGGGMK